MECIGLKGFFLDKFDQEWYKHILRKILVKNIV